MSEKRDEVWIYCPTCHRFTYHMVSGAGNKGSCMVCGKDVRIKKE
jgi:ribosomal protein L44E